MMNTEQDNRKMNPGLAFLCGLGVGVICYLLAESLIPQPVDSPGDHDLMLADRLGFIYTPVVGLWLGWLQRSWWRALIGATVGIGIGIIYMWLCASRNFLAIMVGFPCLLGCVLAVVVGSNRSQWLAGIGARLGKGLFAGLVLGFVYMVVLNVGGAMVMAPDESPADFTKNYVYMMWHIGPIALGISSALFFVLIRWAVGLTRMKILVFEHVEAPKPDNDHAT
ncbi:MAG: hypothetical protein ABSE48_19810 [Verrucomicrobiota bacterium]|jgi:hypothetical protein